MNMSSDFKSLKSEHDTRAEAIEAAAEEAEWPVEYGIIHIDAEDKVSDLKPSVSEPKKGQAESP